MTSEVLLVIHGLGEHSGRYQKLVRMALEMGLGVITFDLPGHGRSPGIRGHAPLKKVLRIVDGLANETMTPPIIFGHSLGGLIAARYVEGGGRAKALILSSPGFDYDRSKVSPGLVKLAEFLSFVLPFLPMDNRIDPYKLSRNQAAVEKYMSDPLVHRKISVALARDFFKEAPKAVEEAEKINVPTMVIVGTADEVTPPEGAREFYKRLRVKDKELVEFEGAYHEIFEDPDYADEFYSQIKNFITSVIGR